MKPAEKFEENHHIFFGNPAVLRSQDPWLCVTGLLRFCPFGKIYTYSWI